MTKHTPYDYLHVIITGTLTTTSPMHCGDGNSLPAKDWKAKKSKTEGSINTVCKDKENKPYLPASTLRGSLRERYQGSDKDLLFGSSHGEGSAGKIRIYDAICKTQPDLTGDQYQHTTSKTTLRDGVAIDPVTQTAKAHHLYVHEVVPADTHFIFNLEADRITQSQLDQLLQHLASWQNTMHSAIGKGRSKGWGKLQLADTLTVKTLNNEAIQQWVEQTTRELKWATQTVTPTQKIDNSTTQINIHIYPTSPLLINDHARVTDGKEVPDLEFMRDQKGKAIIPGSSLKGAVRAHAHRIMATIAHLHYQVDATQAATLVTKSIDSLFGAERKRSLLWFADAIDQSDKKTTPHKQFFNAVDRFTGGVADGALFNVIAADCDKLTAQCHYDSHPKRQPSKGDSNSDSKAEWWKGLLLLIIRDFMQGDFNIGWGKGKGYGQATLSIELAGKEYTDFTALLDYLKQDQQPAQQPAQKWIEQLHTHIQQLANNASHTKPQGA